MSGSSAQSCQTCSRAVTSVSSRLVCESCCRMEHLVCLRQSSGPLPTPLLGDTFFTLLCSKCSPTGREVIKRDKVNWLTALTVAIYNLKKRSPHLGREGFFHWKQHVATFLENHWNIILGPQMKKRKTWLGTISGTLSHWSGDIFRSGLNVLKESGWWALVDERLPADLIATASPNTSKSQTSAPCQQKQSLLLCNNLPSSSSQPVFNPAEINSAAQPESPVQLSDPRKRTRGVQSSILTAMALKEKRATLSEAKDIRKAQQLSTAAALTSASIAASTVKSAAVARMVTVDHPVSGLVSRKSSFDDEIPQKLIKVEPTSSAGSVVSPSNWFDDPSDLPPMFNDDELADFGIKTSSNIFDVKTSTNIVDIRSTNIEIRSRFSPTSFSMDEMMSTSRDSLPNVEELVSGLGNSRNELQNQSEETSANSSCAEEDLESFAENSVEPKRAQTFKFPESNLRPMCRYDEDELLESLENNPKLLANDLSARHLRRKLKVRKQLRSRNLPIFDFDQIVRKLATKGSPGQTSINRLCDVKPEQLNPQILDRFQIPRTCDFSEFENKTLTLRDRLLGRDPFDLQCVTSPLTRRVLKPFIRRDYKMAPLKLKLFQELLQRVRPGEEMERHPIDFMYVRPHHIPLVNQLAREFFWPGIDLSECLQYPDFSCVVVYRRIVVAFAFMVPDVSHSDAYISFVFTHPEWRRVGIAKFMLYHLCQTCMGKDITLHVSANNPAVLLYQKFGFKVEEHIHNFYDKYLPAKSNECKHALFLRLSR